MKFEFFTEDGQFHMEYADYCKTQELVDKVQDDTRLFTNLGLKLFSFDRQYLDEHPKQKQFVEHMEQERLDNPVRFFLPHCAGHDNFDTPSHNYINDDYNTYTGITTGNRYGKTTIAWIKMLLTYGLIPADPKWEVFTEHGVKYNPYLGPRDIGFVSYQWDSHRKVIWPQMMKIWTPREQIKDFLYWEVPNKTNGETIPFACGSRVDLMACSQPQAAFEGSSKDNFVWDEQGVESKFDGAEARTKTRRRYRKDDEGFEHLTRGAHTGGFTPHKLKDRPDTGGGTWLHRLAIGEEKRGMSVGFYEGDIIKDVPDWIYSERQKKADLGSLEEAQEKNNRKRVRIIKSRLFGQWEMTGGLVYDEFDEDVHVINDFEIPWDWCALRMGDHGRTNPTSFLWGAITPDNDWVIFDEYYEMDRTVTQNVQAVVKQSGNKLNPVEGFDSANPRFREEEVEQTFVMDVLDGRTFRSPDQDSHNTIGQLYHNAGMPRLRGAPIDVTSGCSLGITKVKEMLAIREDVKHMKSGKYGAPRLYIMRKCVKLRNHIKAYRNKETTNDDGNPTEKPQSKDDHDLDALRYGITSRALYKPTRTIRPQSKGAMPNEQRRRYWCTEDRPERRSRHVRPSGNRRDRYTGV
jgi:hypothetical protein